ncbi:DUF4304 domain-containing protein [Nakamurella sp. A5-74]|uniref:DUF4304 domain-containing protein n=1 Tax=Nakamurella sp. A5-74 TaxID=3158264 RepID=A0AAU8DRS2_9ACTN
MSVRNVVQQAVDNWGKVSGLEKRSGSWYRTNDEVISVSNLQKSQYGPSYYFNQAFWLRGLGDERYPKENKCHIRLRLGSLLGADAERLDQLLDLDCAVPDIDRVVALAAILTNQLLPVIEQGSSLFGLRSLLDEGVFKAARIGGPAQHLLASVS